MANNTIPVLRFPEFTDQWNSDKLGSIATFSKGKGISKADIEVDGATECIRYGELYTVYSEVISEIVSKTNLDIEKLVLSDANDVIIPASGETKIDIATASCVLKAGVALSGDLNIIKSETDGVFLSYYLNNAKKNKIARLAQGISVVHLYSSQLSSLNVNIPSPDEQTKIAAFLIAIDKRIQILEKKKTELEQYKKGVIQKLFNRTVRFKKDDGSNFPDWTEKKLGEVCKKESSNLSANTLGDSIGEYKVYGATGYLQNVDFYNEKEPYISIVKDGAGVGRTLLCEEKTSVLGTLDIIRPKAENHLYFIFTILNRIHFVKYITGSTIPHIYFRDYSKEKVFMPCPIEQGKIANFIISVDKSIEKVGTQIDDSNVFKKGLLQKMFV
ncbi:restriction endonuclease subunit S [Galbibacter sp. PAP.153]|uniref:restriction endonuclease subunit S n=1 Tax=Galbibacter sp. PAP.153 TaxID=3104623 RepID=UPI003009C401